MGMHNMRAQEMSVHCMSAHDMNMHMNIHDMSTHDMSMHECTRNECKAFFFLNQMCPSLSDSTLLSCTKSPDKTPPH